eukprot:1418508-Prymnesium_polylepis.2
MPSTTMWNTCTPLGAISRASDWQSARIPKLDAAFEEVFGMPRHAAVAPVTPMTPLPRSSMPGVTALARANSAEGPDCSPRSKSSCVVASNDLKAPPEVLTMSTSIAPYCVRIASTVALICFVSLTSQQNPLLLAI